MNRLGLVFLLAAGTAMAGEYAVLVGGARLHIDRHESFGSKIRMYQDAGFIEMDAIHVTAFEPDGAPLVTPPIAPAPPLAAVPPSAPMSPLDLADAAADKYGLPRSLVRSVMTAESGLSARAVSPKGAIGLMQLMPGTAQELGADPFDPAQNVDAGARYLRALLEKYNGLLWHALAAYNAGPGAVERYRGVPPYRETVRYIDAIQRKMDKAESQQ